MTETTACPHMWRDIECVRPGGHDDMHRNYNGVIEWSDDYSTNQVHADPLDPVATSADNLGTDAALIARLRDKSYERREDSELYDDPVDTDAWEQADLFAQAADRLEALTTEINFFVDHSQMWQRYATARGKRAQEAEATLAKVRKWRDSPDTSFIVLNAILDGNGGDTE